MEEQLVILYFVLGLKFLGILIGVIVILVIAIVIIIFLVKRKKKAKEDDSLEMEEAGPFELWKATK